jgi:hypothetical protein
MRDAAAHNTGADHCYGSNLGANSGANFGANFC